MSAHTPGPWKWTAARERGCWISGVLRGRLFTTDHVYPIINSPGVIDGLPVEVDKADADLIAAAPDLLAALKALLAWSTSEYQSNKRIDDQARAAIAKAEGKEIAQLKDAVL